MPIRISDYHRWECGPARQTQDSRAVKEFLNKSLLQRNTHGTRSQLKWAFAFQNGRYAVNSKISAVSGTNSAGNI